MEPSIDNLKNLNKFLKFALFLISLVLVTQPLFGWPAPLTHNKIISCSTIKTCVFMTSLTVLSDLCRRSHQDVVDLNVGRGAEDVQHAVSNVLRLKHWNSIT